MDPAAPVCVCVVALLTTALAEAPADPGRAEVDAVNWERQAAAASADVRVGDYRVTAIVSPAEGWYDWRSSGLVWHDAPAGTVHVKVIVRDLRDGRFVPDLDVRGSFIAGDRTDFVERPMPFGWYPAINGYGDNFPAPEAGQYHLRIEIKPAVFRRHGQDAGRRYSDVTRAEFPPFKVDPAAVRGRESITDATDGARYARSQGTALDRIVKSIFADAISASELESGDYRIGCAAERPRGYWYVEQGKLEYRNEARFGDRNAFVAVFVRDSRSGRLLPGLDVRATVRDGAGQAIGTAAQPFMWDPVLNQYGENWRVPRTGQYRIEVRVNAPKWRRYGRSAGQRFASNASADFGGVRMEAGAAAR